ncbi:probable E3 ubiquitin-protein ligase HECTD2 isoform X1 [Saccostrea echinata]|uniref:probable E3 ubiquitin-protein ligase HECTD2 isoform X1 n=1 Tax=Saccostrea echinata TaxID=191078 RepID=UPI002A823128|nr:probable E3 ubiquitin-protein ligase HECTD2 isoform X1 [Saccostrea echinata]
MAATDSRESSVSVTCPTCDHSVPQNRGSKRIICPKCGNFYDRDSAVDELRQIRRVNREKQSPNGIKDRDEDKDKSGGTLSSIANFFQNLGPSRKTKTPGSQPRSDSEASSHLSESSTKGSSTELPPINQSQTPTGKRTPSYNVNGPLSPRAAEKEKSIPKGDNQRVNTWAQQADSNISQITASANNNKLVYPVRTKTVEQLKEDVLLAKESGNWKVVQDFYATTFESFLEINATFKRDPSKEYKTVEEPGLKFELVHMVYEILLKMPQEIQKVVLKSVINSLLKDKRDHDSRIHWPHTKDDLRAYLVLLQNPQFENFSTYVIFAHLLRQIAALTDHDHHFLVHWMKGLKKQVFQKIIKRLQNFISIRLFPPKPQDLPPMAKCTWWIPSATKVLALLNAANNLTSPTIVQYTEFYNPTLDHLDLMAEYYTWQNPSSCAGFSFCQYPFILSINAKRTVLQRDSEQQMIIMARRSLVAKVQRRQMPDVGMLFLNLTVRRSHLVSDSLNEIARKQHDLKKKLKVTFAGEPGLDMGGLTKEWFLLLIRQIFHSDYGMFTYDKRAGVHWFSSAQCESYQEFNLVGVLMGLAVYNSIILDIHFPPCCFKKLLSPAVVPYNNPQAMVGVSTMSLEDLKTVQADVAYGLQDLLDYDGDVEEDFGLSFQVSVTEFGLVKTIDLKPNGSNIPVTTENRKEYVHLYVDWILNKSVYHQFQAFYHGFHSVCASNALIMLRPQEVEMLVCGNPILDMNELRKVTTYDGYSPQDQVVKNFWEVVLALPNDLQKRLLLFTTGSDRIPVGGMSEMTFKISRVGGTDLLPMSHTCFNMLVLPAYKSKKTMKQKLIHAIQNAEGFGLE